MFPLAHMKLSALSAGFVAAVLLAVLANLALLVEIRHADGASRQAYEQRDQTRSFTEQLLQENDLLTQLVRSFAATGDTRYLVCYHDILAVREGQMPPPVEADRVLYWREVIAARRAREPAATGAPRSLIAAMEALHFTEQELQSARLMLGAAAHLQATEKVAFAVTQGLYDRASGEFVSGGLPDRGYASQLVHTAAYEAASVNLATAASQLRVLTLSRTQAVVDQTHTDLARAILVALVVNLALLPLLWTVVVLMRRRVLQPIARLAHQAAAHAQGNHQRRVGPQPGWAHELNLLGQALDDQRQAVQDELGRRDAVAQALQAERIAAEQAVRAQASFLARMSHQFRLPINAICDMTQLALQTDPSSAQRGYFDNVHGAAQTLQRLINDLLDESGRVSMLDGQADTRHAFIGQMRTLGIASACESPGEVAEPPRLGGAEDAAQAVAWLQAARGQQQPVEPVVLQPRSTDFVRQSDPALPPRGDIDEAHDLPLTLGPALAPLGVWAEELESKREG